MKQYINKYTSTKLLQNCAEPWVMYRALWCKYAYHYHPIDWPILNVKLSFLTPKVRKSASVNALKLNLYSRHLSCAVKTNLHCLSRVA